MSKFTRARRRFYRKHLRSLGSSKSHIRRNMRYYRKRY